MEKGKDFSVLLQELLLKTLATPLIKDRDLHKVWPQNTHAKITDLNFLTNLHGMTTIMQVVHLIYVHQIMFFTGIIISADD